MTTHDRYSSPLAERYASRAMLELWSPATRHGLWRQLWLALAEAEQELGVPIPDEAIAQMRAHLDDIDFDAVADVRAALPPRRDGARPRVRRRGAGGAADSSTSARPARTSPTTPT